MVEQSDVVVHESLAHVQGSFYANVATHIAIITSYTLLEIENSLASSHPNNQNHVILGFFTGIEKNKSGIFLGTCVDDKPRRFRLTL